MKWFAAILVAGVSVQAMADTVVNVRSGQGAAERVSIQGDWARMDGLEEKGEYILGNLTNGVMYVVMPSEKKILELKSNGKSSKKSSDINAQFKKVAKGPDIAGYATDEYELVANGQKCGKTWISKKAGEIKDVKKLLAVMDQFDPEAMMPEGMGGMMQGQMNPCDRAQLMTQLHVAKLGMPMKSVDESGRVEQEVVGIDKNAKLDASLFELPAGYQRTTPSAMINDAMSQMQEMMKNVTPEQRQMMEQMMQQFGGQIPK